MYDYILDISFTTYIVLHIGLSLLIATISTFLLRKQYDKQENLLFSFLLLFAVVLPFLNVILSFCLVVYIVFYKHEAGYSKIHEINMDPFFVAFSKVKRHFGEGVAQEVVEDKNMSLSRKMIVLSMLSQHKTKENIAIIKQMLSSPNDELRLLSFATIDKIENDIHKEIYEQNLSLDKSYLTDIQKTDAQRALAFAYWELIYFGLADETMETFLMGKIEVSCEKVLLADSKDALVHILLGKIYFKRKEYIKSEKMFLYAIDYEKDSLEKKSHFLYSYIAEIYYNMHDFIALRNLMMQTSSLNVNPKLRSIQALWTL